MKSARSSLAVGPLLAALMLPAFAQIAPAQAASAPATPLVVAYGPPKNSTVLHSTFVDLDSLPNTNSRPVFDNPTPAMDKLEVHITTLAPGRESHPPHRHPWEEILFIKDGEVEASINGVTHHAGPGAFVFFASNDPHNARNVSAAPATYYVINFVSDVASSPAAANAPSAATQNVSGRLASTVVDTNSLPQTPTPTGSRAVVVPVTATTTFVGFEAHISTLGPGQRTAPDMIDPNDEIGIVRSGQVEVTVNGVSARMNAGSLMYWAPNDKRSIRNLSATAPASYLVIRATSDKSPKAPAAAR